MLSKVLIFSFLFMAAQAGYVQSGYGIGSAQSGGYVGRVQPRVRFQVLPSASYGVYGGHVGSVSAPVLAAAQGHPSVGSLSSLVLSHPSSGHSNPAALHFPQHAVSSHHSLHPVVLQSSPAHGGHFSGLNGAVAGSHVVSAGSGYVPAHVGGASGNYGGSAGY